MNGTCAGIAASATMDASLADGQLEFPKAFSPNGDGRNDTWEIKNLEKYAANEVIIFNRWGSEVYKVKNYKNDWSAGKLEQGTYFYKVRVTVCDGVQKEFTGYTTLFR
jgi:gliding motility-associated-like protein